MAFHGRDVRRSLKKKGFIEDNKHHIYLYHTYCGKRTGPYTFVSHGKENENVGHDNIRAMRKQLDLDSNKQVHDLVKCPLTEKEYVALLVSKGYQLDAET